MVANKSNIRTWGAWIGGIASWLAISTVLNIIMSKAGIPTYIDFGETIIVEHRYYEEEKDGDFTAIGTALNILAVMFAARIGMAIYEGKIDGGVSEKGNVDFFAWVGGIVLYGIQGAIFFPIFEDTKSDFLLVLLNVINLAIVVGIFFLCKKWRDKKIQKIDATIKARSE